MPARLVDALALGPAVLVLEGEPGIGKTTLWQAAVESALARGIRVLASRPGFAETRPFSPFRENRESTDERVGEPGRRQVPAWLLLHLTR